MGRWMCVCVCVREHVRVRSAEQILSIERTYHPNGYGFGIGNVQTHTHTHTRGLKHMCTVVVQSIHAMLGADGEHMHRERSKQREFPEEIGVRRWMDGVIGYYECALDGYPSYTTIA